jgi:hypothetical protein
MAPRRKKQKLTTTLDVESSPSEVVPSVVVCVEQTFQNDLLLQNIVSFVGEYQYLFVASINHTFHDAYITLFPSKETHYNGSTMKLLKFCYNKKFTSKEKHDLLQSTARYGNIEGLRYLRTKNDYEMILDNKTIISIVQNTYLHVLKWAQMIRADVNWSFAIEQAAEHGSMILLEWLYTKHQSKFTATACRHASLGGQLHTLQWLQERDYALNENIFHMAAENGHLEVLQWAPRIRVSMHR